MEIAQINIGQFFKTPFNTSKGIPDIVKLVLEGSLAISGVILLVLLIGAGISLISGAGSGKADDLEKGKKTATAALIGFLIVVFAYYILRLIEIIFLRATTPFTGT